MKSQSVIQEEEFKSKVLNWQLKGWETLIQNILVFVAVKLNVFFIKMMHVINIQKAVAVLFFPL